MIKVSSFLSDSEHMTLVSQICTTLSWYIYSISFTCLAWRIYSHHPQKPGLIYTEGRKETYINISTPNPATRMFLLLNIWGFSSSIELIPRHASTNWDMWFEMEAWFLWRWQSQVNSWNDSISKSTQEYIPLRDDKYSEPFITSVEYLHNLHPVRLGHQTSILCVHA
jgi:hypothetical protein